ncbi:hypothetical protein NEUTE1DRAFT_119376 [Neurospora tetrasperma FGSC 2508]|uniref:WW domain-containing protein n=1 Tax=Neurospora tetrasperma (strain FGSC 2508 / ATCC MYA-4615 / P0657) TaxID=510951 RepID=F8MAJ7_NEUT8|nr:uncharacterized protein NEUTE1DRAFT_119376 [Neurospora tetrasperma FGSC 2508]EGO60118.1 hypothetical protein NEUTE1DRAFT_119376 [Neurospora tetrasperma FGSC 2508]EGZ75932.1 hypothetical protein NEUTE2DRAFT_106276 [Neurospora tetrasperma FGSC 2509]
MSNREEPPPSYEQAMASSGQRDTRPGTSDTSSRPGTSSGGQQTHPHTDNLLHVPGDDDRHHGHDGIPTPTRLSMEDELRPLPPGWVRTYDPETNHQFFVDTQADPIRSIWHHPYDDDLFLNSLPPAERTRIEQLKHQHSGSGDNHSTSRPTSSRSSRAHSPQPPRSPRRADAQQHEEEEQGKSLGRKLKDALTGTTHSERVEARAARDRAEREALRQHLLVRRAMAKAMETSRPQLLGKDDNGVDLYLEPPGQMYPGVVAVKPLTPWLSEVFYERDRRSGNARLPGPLGRYLRPEGSMYGFGSGYGARGYPGYGARPVGGGTYVRPQGPYARPMRPVGYGGGLGLPLMAPMLGGVMLGSLMF